jgi:hypothetical protein
MTTMAQAQVWTREAVLDLLDRSDKAVVQALKTLAARQTTDELETKTTKIRNGRGFNARDAALLTDIASKLPRYNDHMTPRQLLLVRGRIRKYVGQLLEEIELKGGVVERKSQPAKSVTDDDDLVDVDALAERALEESNSAWAEQQTAIDERASFGAWA